MDGNKKPATNSRFFISTDPQNTQCPGGEGEIALGEEWEKIDWESSLA